MIKTNKTPTEGFKFVPSSQKGETSPFSVSIKPLTSKQVLLLEDKLVKRSGESDVTFSTGEFSYNTCKLGIIEWENIEDSEGKTLKLVKGSDGTVSDVSMSAIPSAMITEIANIIITISRDSAQIPVLFDATE